MADDLTPKQSAWIDHFVICRNKTEAAARAGYKGNRNTLANIGSQNYRKPKIRAALNRRLRESTMNADEVLSVLDEQARADLGEFFKLVEEWTFFPLPTDDILDAEEVLDDSDPENERLRVSYLIRRVAIDTEKLLDPTYSHLLHKFSASPRSGVSLELYDKQKAAIQLGKHYALFTDVNKNEDWRDKALEYIRNKEVSYESLSKRFGASLAAELFRLAGVSVVSGGRPPGNAAT